jgi:hypothetical protein
VLGQVGQVGEDVGTQEGPAGERRAAEHEALGRLLASSYRAAPLADLPQQRRVLGAGFVAPGKAQPSQHQYASLEELWGEEA